MEEAKSSSIHSEIDSHSLSDERITEILNEIDLEMSNQSQDNLKDKSMVDNSSEISLVITKINLPESNTIPMNKVEVITPKKNVFISDSVLKSGQGDKSKNTSKTFSDGKNFDNQNKTTENFQKENFIENTVETKVSPAMKTQEISSDKEIERQLEQCICIDVSRSESSLSIPQKGDDMMGSISNSSSDCKSDLSSLHTNSIESVEIIGEEAEKASQKLINNLDFLSDIEIEDISKDPVFYWKKSYEDLAVDMAKLREENQKLKQKNMILQNKILKLNDSQEKFKKNIMDSAQRKRDMKLLSKTVETDERKGMVQTTLVPTSANNETRIQFGKQQANVSFDFTSSSRSLTRQINSSDPSTIKYLHKFEIKNLASIPKEFKRKFINFCKRLVPHSVALFSIYDTKNVDLSQYINCFEHILRGTTHQVYFAKGKFDHNTLQKVIEFSCNSRELCLKTCQIMDIHPTFTLNQEIEYKTEKIYLYSTCRKLFQDRDPSNTIHEEEKKSDQKCKNKKNKSFDANKMDQFKLKTVFKAMAKTGLLRSLRNVEVNKESFPLIEIEEIISQEGFHDVFVIHKKHKYPIESVR
ncbi:unnamed protein product [Moneuplotes crassus]|uniref:Uncharacterized protein n=1 Tax=Euplotes crassus TaxID=5936 RepID=A0AAD1XMQ6_EUPCR|nr:unnamed protein product [Moneuplotes crassus]